MALIIDDEAVERLAAEVSRRANETPTEAIRKALEERNERLGAEESKTERLARMKAALDEFWRGMPQDVRGRSISKAEREEILGYGPHGY